jgi:hypothetical protein
MRTIQAGISGILFIRLLISNKYVVEQGGSRRSLNENMNFSDMKEIDVI